MEGGQGALPNPDGMRNDAEISNPIPAHRILVRMLIRDGNSFSSEGGAGVVGLSANSASSAQDAWVNWGKTDVTDPVGRLQPRSNDLGISGVGWRLVFSALLGCNSRKREERAGSSLFSASIILSPRSALFFQYSNGGMPASWRVDCRTPADFSAPGESFQAP